MPMQPVTFKRHRFPPDVIRLAVWLYFRFTLSFRDVEEMLAQRDIEASYETIQCWTRKFGQSFAQNLRRSRSKPTGRWHLDKMVVQIGGKRMWLWRAVDDEGEVLDMLVQKRRNTDAALRLLRKLLKRQGGHPEIVVTDMCFAPACHRCFQPIKFCGRPALPLRSVYAPTPACLAPPSANWAGYIALILQRY